VQFQMLAAFADRPINTVYAARQTADCRLEQQIDGTPQAGARQLAVFLDEFSGFARMQALAAKSNLCRMGSGMVVCSDIPGEVESLETLARSTRK